MLSTRSQSVSVIIIIVINHNAAIYPPLLRECTLFSIAYCSFNLSTTQKVPPSPASSSCVSLPAPWQVSIDSCAQLQAAVSLFLAFVGLCQCFFHLSTARPINIMFFINCNLFFAVSSFFFLLDSSSIHRVWGSLFDACCRSFPSATYFSPYWGHRYYSCHTDVIPVFTLCLCAAHTCINQSSSQSLCSFFLLFYHFCL